MPFDDAVWSSVPIVAEEAPVIETLTEMTLIWTVFFGLVGLWSSVVPAVWLWRKHDVYRWIFRSQTAIVTKSNLGKNVVKVLKLLGLVTNKGDKISQPGKDTLILALVMGLGQFVAAKNPDYIPFFGYFLLFCGGMKIGTALFLLGIRWHSGRRLLTNAGLGVAIVELVAGLLFIYFARAIYINPFDADQIRTNITNANANASAINDTSA